MSIPSQLPGAVTYLYPKSKENRPLLVIFFKTLKNWKTLYMNIFFKKKRTFSEDHLLLRHWITVVVDVASLSVLVGKIFQTAVSKMGFVILTFLPISWDYPDRNLKKHAKYVLSQQFFESKFYSYLKKKQLDLVNDLWIRIKS